MPKTKSSELYQKIQNMLCVYAQEANEWVKFSKRDTVINAARFVQILVLGWLKKKDASLNELAHSGRDLGVQISGSALQERMGKEAVMLLASVLQRTLESWRGACPLPFSLLKSFRGIYITDSSQIALPERMVSLFRGNQSNAMLKLQVTWDYLSGNLAAIELEDGRSPDQKCQLHVSHAQADTLQLFDLGYFKQEYLQDIHEQGGYFVSRYQTQTALYSMQTHARFDLVAWLKALPTNQADCQLLLGGRVQLPVRLLVRRLSQTAADARRRKAKKKAKKQGTTCSAIHLFLLGWELLVTNLSPVWTLPQVFDLYGIRFQVEWVFRIWKTQLGVDIFADWRIERVLCQLYAHLLGIILSHLLTVNWRWQDDVEYSFAKCVQVIQQAMPSLLRCLARAGWGFAAWVQRLEDDFRTFSRKTKRRKSPSTAQRIYNWGLS